MSVINKMLLDLDARQEPVAGSSKDADGRLLKGTAGISGPWAAKSPARSRPWLTGLLVLVAAAAAAWYVFDLEHLLGDKAQALPVVVIATKPQPAPSSVAAPAPAPEVSLPIVTATTSVRSDAALAALTAPAVNAAPLAASVLAPAAKAPLLMPAATPRPPLAAPPTQPKTVTPVPVQPKLAAGGGASEKPAGSATSVRSDAAVPASPPKTAVAPSPVPGPAGGPLVQSQAAVAKPAAVSGPSTPAPAQAQRAARETLAHAQGLWAAGSHGAALDLMRQSVAAAERAYQAGTLAAGSPELASLVRELARMDLAEGRVSRVLEMLTRLEPALAGHADLWAVRGNAAQRLARHEESVHAYLQALELRPGESRWMLGAAVSLAALGRLEAAAEQAEKARAAGVVSPDILAYLRQAGVPLK